MIGYTTYAPSKYALRGLGECLRNELCRDNIRVSMFYPSNMDTPAFAIENKTKPAETVLIEGSASTVTAEKAADQLLAGQLVFVFVV
jgi:short-subunit dehydrogenase